ncbi:hypothetical protein COTS27_01007 [Spirochaetota bacterium]|nr:hypothetical protein COTS27_01007 [Spirochaetota bacterium]
MKNRIMSVVAVMSMVASVTSLRYKKIYSKNIYFQMYFLFLFALSVLLGCMTTNRVGVVVPGEIPDIVALIKESNVGNQSLKVFVDSTDSSGLTILVSGLTNNASGRAASWTLNLDQSRGVITFPTSISVAPSAVISPHSQEDMIAYTVGTGTPVMYRVKTHVYGAAISDWFTSASTGQLFGGVVFTTEYAGVTIPTQRVSGSSLSVDGSRLFINDLANVPDGTFTLNANNFPAGFSLTGNEGTLADPDGMGIGALTNALLLGELQVSETFRPGPGFPAEDLQPNKSYSISANLRAYPFPFSSENIQASFFRLNKLVGPISQTARTSDIIVADNTEIDGPSTVRVTGFTNVPGIAVPDTFAVEPATGITINSPRLSIAIPDGYVLDAGADTVDAAINNPLGSREEMVPYEAIVIREVSSGLTRVYEVSVDFYRYLQLQIVSGNIIPDSPAVPGLVVIGEGDYVFVTNSCELLARSTLSFLDNAGRADPSVRVSSAITSYFDVYDASVRTTNIGSTDYYVVSNNAMLSGAGAGSFEFYLGFPICTLSGSGTPADPYLIENSVHLNVLSYNLSNTGSHAQFADKHYRLTKDINMGAFSDQESLAPPWSRLAGGGGFYPMGVFTGTFDCRGYAISNLFVNPHRPRLDIGDSGFFSVLSNATVTNCRIANAYVAGGYRMGGLVGSAIGSTIHDIVMEGVTMRNRDCIGGGWHLTLEEIQRRGVKFCRWDVGFGVGGLAGKVSGGSVSRVNVIDIDYSGDYYGVGGVVGVASGLAMNQIYASGIVSGRTAVGGLVGQFFSRSSLSESASEVNVYGGNNVGGLVGENEADIRDSDMYGSVRGGIYGRVWYETTPDGVNAGGIVGKHTASLFSDDVGRINNVLMAGYVSGSGYSPVGGLVGYEYTHIGRSPVGSRNRAYSANDFVNGDVTGVVDRLGSFDVRTYYGKRCYQPSRRADALPICY